MLGLGFVVAGVARVASCLKELGRPADWAYEMVFAALVGGLVGARLWSVIENWDEAKDDIFGSLFSGSGLVFYGGAVRRRDRRAGLGQVARRARPQDVRRRRAGRSPRRYAIGRIGCQLAGDGDYGKAWDGPWAMAYPDGTVPTTEEVHPTPIYETIAMGGVAVVPLAPARPLAAGRPVRALPRARGRRALPRRVPAPQRPGRRSGSRCRSSVALAMMVGGGALAAAACAACAPAPAVEPAAATPLAPQHRAQPGQRRPPARPRRAGPSGGRRRASRPAARPDAAGRRASAREPATGTRSSPSACWIRTGTLERARPRPRAGARPAAPRAPRRRPRTPAARCAGRARAAAPGPGRSPRPRPRRAAARRDEREVAAHARAAQRDGQPGREQRRGGGDVVDRAAVEHAAASRRGRACRSGRPRARPRPRRAPCRRGSPCATRRRAGSPARPTASPSGRSSAWARAKAECVMLPRRSWPPRPAPSTPRPPPCRTAACRSAAATRSSWRASSARPPT